MYVCKKLVKSRQSYFSFFDFGGFWLAVHLSQPINQKPLNSKKFRKNIIWRAFKKLLVFLILNQEYQNTLAPFKLGAVFLDVWSHLDRRSFRFSAFFLASSSDSTITAPLIVMAFSLGGVGPSNKLDIFTEKSEN